jgi:hypothetical protein
VPFGINALGTWEVLGEGEGDAASITGEGDGDGMGFSAVIVKFKQNMAAGSRGNL